MHLKHVCHRDLSTDAIVLHGKEGFVVNESGGELEIGAKISTNNSNKRSMKPTCQLHLIAAYYDFLKGPGLNHNILNLTLK